MRHSEEFFDLLDEQPRTPTSILVRARGETRSLPIAAASKAFELRARQGGAPRFPQLQRARNQLALLAALLDKAERQ
jgi:hypothetical protein